MIDLIKDYSETKQGCLDILNKTKEDIKDGFIDPLDIAREIAFLTLLCKEFNSDVEIQDSILDEASKYGGKEFEAKNIKIQVREVGVKYDYKNCGHSGWLKYNNEKEECSKKIKDIESILKHVKESSQNLVDSETGEMISPPSKKSTTKAVISLLNKTI